MTVEPIRDKDSIKKMFYYLNGKDKKYGLLFKCGLNTGLRISDILPLRVKDIFNDNGTFKDYLVIKEKKTGKEKNKIKRCYPKNARILYKRTSIAARFLSVLQ